MMTRSRTLVPGPLLVLAALTLALPSTAQARSSFTVDFQREGYARIPFDVSRNHIWVRGAIGKSDSVWIVIDTGAAASVMDAGLSQTLGFQVGSAHQAMGAGGHQQGWSVGNVDVRLDGLTMHRDSMDTIDLGALSAAGARPMQVILGYELFASSVVRFDYAAGVMEVWDPDHAPRKWEGTSVPMTLINNHPYVEGSLKLPGGPPYKGRFVIDTGSSAGLILSPEFAAREGLVNRFPRTLEYIGRGVGGEMRTHHARAEAFSIGELEFPPPIVVVPELSGHFSARGTLGNIGGDLLGRCRVTFDYARHRVRFEPNPDFAKPFDADMLGAAILRDSTGWSVRAVTPSTPASEVGLRVGDRVAGVDGTPADQLNPTTLRKLLQTEGRSVPIVVRRGEQDTTVNVVLRKIL